MNRLSVPLYGARDAGGVFGLLREFSYFLWLDSSRRTFDPYRRYSFWGAAASAPRKFETLEDLESGFRQQDNWLAGGASYEANRTLEPRIKLADRRRVFPECAFFEPEVVIYKPARKNELVIEAESPEIYLKLLERKRAAEPRAARNTGAIPPRWTSNFTKKRYLETIGALREHIRQGDIYEINLTQKFASEIALDDPAGLFLRLQRLSPTPFAACFKYGDYWALSASPERFLQHENRRLITQPIKGTIRRAPYALADALLKQRLRREEKFRAENVMIVDLARNDLNRVSEPYSVRVPALFQTQSYKHLHHLVSTVEGRLAAAFQPFDALRAAFPPGSMTGAPKCRAMELIDEYEAVPRGLYAGGLGYVAPNRDFDFNVVIRTLVYNIKTRELNYHTGGALTFDSDPLEEYEETLLKAKAIRKVFGDSSAPAL